MYTYTLRMHVLPYCCDSFAHVSGLGRQHVYYEDITHFAIYFHANSDVLVPPYIHIRLDAHIHAYTHTFTRPLPAYVLHGVKQLHDLHAAISFVFHNLNRCTSHAHLTSHIARCKCCDCTLNVQQQISL